MEIQDLTYENQYRKPIPLQDQPFTNLPQESKTFRTIEGLVEVSISSDFEDESNQESPQSFQQESPRTHQFESNSDLKIEDLSDGFEAKSAELSDRLRQFYSSHGIQAPVAADMTVDSQGRIVISGDFKQKNQLQAKFENEDDLGALYSDLSASASLLHAADVNENFAQKYNRNPTTALNENLHLFSDSFKFSLQFEDNQLSAGFRPENGDTIQWWREAKGR